MAANGHITHRRSYSLPGEPDCPETIREAALASLAASVFSGVATGTRETATASAMRPRAIAEETEREAEQIWCSQTGLLSSVVKCMVTVGLRTPMKRPTGHQPSAASSRIPEEREFRLHVAPVPLEGIETEDVLRATMLGTANDCVEQQRSTLRSCVSTLKDKRSMTSYFSSPFYTVGIANSSLTEKTDILFEAQLQVRTEESRPVDNRMKAYSPMPGTPLALQRAAEPRYVMPRIYHYT
jgi:hypothetical protein